MHYSRSERLQQLIGNTLRFLAWISLLSTHSNLGFYISLNGTIVPYGNAQGVVENTVMSQRSQCFSNATKTCPFLMSPNKYYLLRCAKKALCGAHDNTEKKSAYLLVYQTYILSSIVGCVFKFCKNFLYAYFRLWLVKRQCWIILHIVATTWMFGKKVTLKKPRLPNWWILFLRTFWWRF